MAIAVAMATVMPVMAVDVTRKVMVGFPEMLVQAVVAS